MECLREDSAIFFQNHTRDLIKLQEDSSQMLAELYRNSEKLEEKMELARVAHEMVFPLFSSTTRNTNILDLYLQQKIGRQNRCCS